MKKIAVVLSVLLLMALVLVPVVSAQPAAPAGAHTPGNLPITPEPPTPTATATEVPTATPTATPTPRWDKSSIEVTGICDQGKPTFTILNHGAAMQGATRYWFVNAAASAATCGAITVDPLLGETFFQLGAGESLTTIFPNDTLLPPYSICVAQRPGHPGTGYAAETVQTNPLCVTAEGIVDEPSFGRWRAYLPQLGTGRR